MAHHLQNRVAGATVGQTATIPIQVRKRFDVCKMMDRSFKGLLYFENVKRKHVGGTAVRQPQPYHHFGPCTMGRILFKLFDRSIRIPSMGNKKFYIQENRFLFERWRRTVVAYRPRLVVFALPCRNNLAHFPAD